MKRIFFLLMLAVVCTTATQAQKWQDLSNEQKLMKAKEFRQESQDYLKKLGLSEDQLADMDDVNLCYLTTLGRIDRYGKDDNAKLNYAKSATKARATQMDAIMGPDRRAKYQKFISDKIKNSPLAGLVK